MMEYEILSKNGGREKNEDSVGMVQRENACCFVLADGLGGHGGGKEASELVTKFILEDFSQKGEVSREYLQECIQAGQDLLLEEQMKQDRRDEMKTTLVVFLADEKRVLWAHIGDSRLYYFHNKKYGGRTLDHSVPQMLVMAGEIKEKEIRGHADRNRLLRVMGIEWDRPKYQLSEELEWKKEMEFLLCSDGFWELIEEKMMTKLLKKSASPAEWLKLMEQEVLKNGEKEKMDNYSAIAVFLDRHRKKEG